MKKIAIIGSGSWGVALAIHAAKMGNKVKIWSFAEEEADLINNEKKCKFLPDAVIPDGVVCTTNIKEAIEGSDMILHVTPSKYVDAPIIEEYPLTLECEMESFEDGILVGKVVNTSIDENYLDENGKIDVEKMQIIAFDMVSNTYRVLGDVVGNAFKDGLDMK